MVDLNDLPTGSDGSDFSGFTPEIAQDLIRQSVSRVSDEEIEQVVQALQNAQAQYAQHKKDREFVTETLDSMTVLLRIFKILAA